MFIICLSRSNLHVLGEVGAHVPLEVEVRKLIRLAQLEEGRKLGIRDDLATILLVLESVRTNVLVDIASHLRARHLGSNRLLEELGKLITDSSGLDESRRSAVSSLALALGGLLLSHLKLLGPLLLEDAVLRLEGRNHSTNLLELGEEISGLLGHNIIENNLIVGDSGGGGGLHRRTNDGGGGGNGGFGVGGFGGSGFFPLPTCGVGLL